MDVRVKNNIAKDIKRCGGVERKNICDGR